MEKEMSKIEKDILVGYAMKCAGQLVGEELMKLINLCDRLMKAKVIERETDNK